MARTKSDKRIVYVAIDEEIYVETPVGAIVVTCDTHYGHPRVDVHGNLYDDSFTHKKTKQFASITLGRKRGLWTEEWEHSDNRHKVARVRQARRREALKRLKR